METHPGCGRAQDLGLRTPEALLAPEGLYRAAGAGGVQQRVGRVSVCVRDTERLWEGAFVSNPHLCSSLPKLVFHKVDSHGGFPCPAAVGCNQQPPQDSLATS